VLDTTPGELYPIPQVRGFRPIVTGPLWRVEVQVMGLAVQHRWTGFADNESEATRRGRDDARQTWRGHPLCVRSCVQVGV
jgi:hypothetical protein